MRLLTRFLEGWAQTLSMVEKDKISLIMLVILRIISLIEQKIQFRLKIKEKGLMMEMTL